MPRKSIFEMPFSKVYEALVNKAEKKGRTKAEVDEIVRWLTGYSDLLLSGRRSVGMFRSPSGWVARTIFREVQGKKMQCRRLSFWKLPVSTF